MLIVHYWSCHHASLGSDDYDDADMMLSGLDYGASPPMLKHFGAPAGPPGLPGGAGLLIAFSLCSCKDRERSVHQVDSTLPLTHLIAQGG